LAGIVLKFARLTLITFVLGCGRANGQHTDVIAKRLESIKRTATCVDTSRIRLTVAPKTNRQAACWLAGLAMAETGGGRGICYGVAPDDSAGVSAISLKEMHFPGLRGADDDWYWSVTWKPPKKRYGVEVIIEQLNSTVIVRRAEAVTP
jgi:hypothetical protein